MTKQCPEVSAREKPNSPGINPGAFHPINQETIDYENCGFSITCSDRNLLLYIFVERLFAFSFNRFILTSLM